MARAAELTSATFRQVLSCYPTGVVGITAVDGDAAVGMAANSFTSVSLEPPLVLFCAGHSSTTWPRIRAAGRFAVNVFAHDQSDLCARFASSGGDRFEGSRWTPSPLGSPVLDGTAAVLDCEIADIHLAGDHDIVVGRVAHAFSEPDRAPLVFHQGGYAALAGLDANAASS